MKYIIDIPDEHTDIKVFYTDANMKIIQSMRCESYTEPDRKAIEDEVWEFAQKFTHESKAELNAHERVEIWGTASCDKIINDFTYSEAKAKYEAWKKRKDEIRVGDEVISAFGDKMVVTHHWHRNDGTTGVTGFSTDCSGLYYDEIEVEKTGRHFSEVEELLKKLGDE